MEMVANDHRGTELARPTAKALFLTVNQSPLTPSQQWKGVTVMSTATDKLNAIEVWIDTGWVDSQAKPIQPVVIPDEIIKVLTAKPKPTRKPRK